MEPVVAISAIEHYSYCPRQCALIHVDGIWLDNAHTVRGRSSHKRADLYAGRLERGVRVVRALPLWSERLGLTGRADAVEFRNDGSVVPVEYKMGRRHGDSAHLQLVAQALCLEEMLGVEIAVGLLWFSAPRRRISVSIDTDRRSQALQVIEAVRQAIIVGALPGAPNDERCRECQLLSYCLPSLVSQPEALKKYMRGVVGCA